jgi:hypothetical protein
MSAMNTEPANLVSTLLSNGTLNSRNLNVKSPDADKTTTLNWQLMEYLINSDNVSKNFSKLINDMLLTVASYEAAATVVRSLVAPLSAATGKIGRILVTLPDGTVCFDSSRDGNTDTTKLNTFTNADKKTINENHNTRCSIMSAQCLQAGIAFERKYSTSTKRLEDYVSLRVGVQGVSEGTVRYSVN